MRSALFRVTRAALCVLCGAALSALELGFFGDVPYLSLQFLAILAITIPAVFLCAGARGNVLYIFAYTLALTFLLEILGFRTDIRILLVCLVVQALMYAQTGFSANAARFRVKRPPYGASLIVIILCVSAVAAATLFIYRNVLEPLLPESEKYALFHLEPPPKAEKPSRAEQVHAEIDGGADAVTPPKMREPLDPRIFLITALALALLLGGYVAFRYLRYRLWRRKTLAAPPEERISALYRHFLRALYVCGHPINDGETPFEYANRTKAASLPVPIADVTDAFVASQYSGQMVTEAENEQCAELLSRLPKLIKSACGRRFYYLTYLRHMY